MIAKNLIRNNLKNTQDIQDGSNENENGMSDIDPLILQKILKKKLKIKEKKEKEMEKKVLRKIARSMESGENKGEY